MEPGEYFLYYSVHYKNKKETGEGYLIVSVKNATPAADVLTKACNNIIAEYKLSEPEIIIKQLNRL